MHKKSSSKKVLIKRVLTYVGMTLAVVIIATYVVFFTLGYRFNIDDRQIEQYAMLQFNSAPSGATILIDGKNANIKTPDEATVPAGEHTITMNLKGYQTWTKTVKVDSGVLSWLNYALLIPEELTVEPVANYTDIYKSVASPNGHYVLVQTKQSTPQFDLVDISSNTIKQTSLTIPLDVYSESESTTITHSFSIDKWDDGGRYVLIKHTYGDKYEWLVLDTQDVKLTKNITKLFDFAITNIQFIGTSGNAFYALGNGDIRKIDVSAGTISRPLISDVSSFSIFGSSIICYVANNPNTKTYTVGLYRDGDDASYVVKTIDKTEDMQLNAAVSNYFNEYYVAIANGTSVEVLSGSFPSSTNESGLKNYVSFTTSQAVQKLSFSPSGQYVFVQSGANFSSYDLEYKSLTSSTIAGNGDNFSTNWLNNNYVWSDRDGSLAIREFDGANIHIINKVSVDQSVAIATNGRYIYSINSVATGGYQLQRVRIILP
jgi:hypothetical protein